jgi:hypothetical protein
MGARQRIEGRCNLNDFSIIPNEESGEEVTSPPEREG